MPTPAAGLLSNPTVQLHPTLRCNLQCSHCYSSSHPHASTGLDVEHWLARLALLHTQGYNHLSLSGGEPLLYPAFDELLDGAIDLGFSVTMVSNGTKITPALARQLLGRINTLAISFDGLQALHDEIRGKGAHARALRGLHAAIDAGLLVGLSHCVSRRSLSTLPDLLDCAEHWGVDMVQLHALTPTGRGIDLHRTNGLEPFDLIRLLLITEIARARYAGTFALQLDLLTKAALIDRLQDFCTPNTAIANAPLSELVNPVVMGADGTLYPHSYGLHRNYKIAEGDLAQFKACLANYGSSGYLQFKSLVARCADWLDHEDLAVVDWYKLLLEQSQHAEIADIDRRSLFAES